MNPMVTSNGLPRMQHAAQSAVTSGRGADDHRVLSIPDLAAPRGGSMTAVFGWYPGRFGGTDAFRMGNYSLLTYPGEDIGRELLHPGSHSLLSRIDPHKLYSAPDPGLDS